MGVPVLCVCIAMLATATGVVDAMDLTDEQYYQMPKLFELDDYDECFAKKRAAFCVGTFDLTATTDNRLFEVLQKFTEQEYKFNHTRVHRGYCVSARCRHVDDVSLPRRFAKCVNNATRERYGLGAKLSSLDYCETERSSPLQPVDTIDLTYLVICALIVMMNVLGTVYSLMRNIDHKPNRYLMAWSFTENWRRLTASYENGDAKLNALQPLHGMKAMTLLGVLLAHSSFVYHMCYLYNPRFLEEASLQPLSTILQNGTVVVQTFIMLSSFLLAYNTLLHMDSHPEKKFNLTLLRDTLISRIVRITPAYAFVMGVVTTWWRHASSGPLWAPMVGGECARCRRKWWTQLLYINNFINVDEKCLIQTWFLAVDMQLYVVAALLLVTLGRRQRAVAPVLGALLVAAVVANFTIAYTWNLKPFLLIKSLEVWRSRFTGDASFNWMYSAPWSSLPASLLGLAAAFLHRHWQQIDFKPNDSLVCRMLYRLSIVCIPVWILGGHLLKDMTSPAYVALYAALDRPVFCLIITVAMFGFIYKIDSLCWKLMSWSGWRPLSRMSLSILLVHWCYNLMLIGVKTDLARASVYEIGGHWHVVIFMTYVTSLPLHLLVELPLHKFCQALLS